VVFKSHGFVVER